MAPSLRPLVARARTLCTQAQLGAVRSLFDADFRPRIHHTTYLQGIKSK